MKYPICAGQLIIISVVLCTTWGTTTPPKGNPLMLKFDKWFEDHKHPPGPYGSTHVFNAARCNLQPELIDEIYALKRNVAAIVDTIMNGQLKRTSAQNLTAFRNRSSEAKVLDNVMSLVGDTMMDLKLTNVHEEIAEVPVWSRGIEIAMIMYPFKMELTVRAFGMSGETPKKGITAPIIVVHSFRELEDQRDDVMGRIVVFNTKGADTQMHIIFGPAVAAKYGAIAVLCRSPIEMIFSPAVIYEEGGRKIPAGIISRDDADKLERFSSRNDVMTVFLVITEQVRATRSARNVFGDYVGTELKNEFVMLTSHIGSWDQGDGVQHDAVGIVLQMLTINILQSLHLRPKRTIRIGILSAEESGFKGTTKWVKRHHDELANFTSAVEADLDCLKATGLILSGTNEAACIMKEVMALYEDKTGMRLLSKLDGLPAKVLPGNKPGVPMISFNGDDEYASYFGVQHTDMESGSAVDPDEMDKCLATLASTVYILAELKDRLPRK